MKTSKKTSEKNEKVSDNKPTDSQVLAFTDPSLPQNQSTSSERLKDTSVIGKSLHFKGELSVGEDLVIQGIVEGQINQGSCSLTLEPGGKILANVNATRIFIEGEVVGDLQATETVTIRPQGNVEGNIIAPSVVIDQGATFNGSIDMTKPK